MNLYDQGNYNLAAQALGQPQISSQPSATQAYNLGQQYANDPEAQAVAAVSLMQQNARAGGSGFSPWTDPASGAFSLSATGASANSWMPSPATGGDALSGPTSVNAATSDGGSVANPAGANSTTAGGSTGQGPAGLLGNCSQYRNSSAASSNCLVGGGGGLVSVPCVLNACQAKALISGGLVLAGGLLMLVGTALLFADKGGILGKAAEAAGAVYLVKGASSAIQRHAPKSGGLSDSAQYKASTQSRAKTGGGPARPVSHAADEGEF
jgi:hypothetical protein